MICFPNAKINLGLRIVSKRDDGYHNIESCFYPIPLQDCLEVIKAASFSFHSYGLTIPGQSSSNLCVKAYELLKEKYDIPPVEIHLLKHIPMGAGLGGGSADGAATLVALNMLFGIGITDDDLETLALNLGSDCPFFIRNHPAIATGRGEQLAPLSLDLRGHYLAIKNPGIHISTQEAYQGVTPKLSSQTIQKILSGDIQDWKQALSNEFEASIFSRYPEIQQLKEDMYQAGATYASMTGSGSTVYGIFEKPLRKNSTWEWLPL